HRPCGMNNNILLSGCQPALIDLPREPAHRTGISSRGIDHHVRRPGFGLQGAGLTDGLRRAVSLSWSRFSRGLLRLAWRHCNRGRFRRGKKILERREKIVIVGPHRDPISPSRLIGMSEGQRPPRIGTALNVVDPLFLGLLRAAVAPVEAVRKTVGMA